MVNAQTNTEDDASDSSLRKILLPQTTPSSVKSNSLLPVYLYNEGTGEIERCNIESLVTFRTLLFPEVRDSSIFMPTALSEDFVREALPIAYDLQAIFQLMKAPSCPLYNGRWHTFPELNAKRNNHVEEDVAKYYDSLATVAETHFKASHIQHRK